MRPFILSSLLLGVAACADEYDSNPSDADYSVEVIGSFQRVNPDGPQPRWVGVEYTRMEDRHGTMVCDDTLDADGPTLSDDHTQLTLEMVRAQIRDLDVGCELEFEVQESLTSGALFLSFDGEAGRFGEERGSVYTSSDLDSWTWYGVGLRMGDSLTYHRSWTFSEPDDGPPEVIDWDHRPLQELPIY